MAETVVEFIDNNNTIEVTFSETGFHTTGPVTPVAPVLTLVPNADGLYGLVLS